MEESQDERFRKPPLSWMFLGTSFPSLGLSERKDSSSVADQTGDLYRENHKLGDMRPHLLRRGDRTQMVPPLGRLAPLDALKSLIYQ